MRTRFRKGYEVMEVGDFDDSPMHLYFRLKNGPNEYDWFALSDHWLDSFDYPSKNEPDYPYDSRDDSITRLYGA